MLVIIRCYKQYTGSEGDDPKRKPLMDVVDYVDKLIKRTRELLGCKAGCANIRIERIISVGI
jgi:hypothetical protein